MSENFRFQEIGLKGESYNEQDNVAAGNKVDKEPYFPEHLVSSLAANIVPSPAKKMKVPSEVTTTAATINTVSTVATNVPPNNPPPEPQPEDDAAYKVEEQEWDDLLEPNPEEKRAGVEKVVFAGNRPIKIINPVFRQNRNAHNHWPHGRPAVWVEAKVFSPPMSVQVCKGITKYLADEDLIKHLHAYTNGMLNRWRLSAIDILEMANGNSLFNHQRINHQLKFARKDVLKAMAGIGELTTFPIHILNKRSIQALVKGVDTEEMAQFILSMANCTYFSIIAFPKSRRNHFDMVTRFDMNDHSMKVYGTTPSTKMPNPATKLFPKIGRFHSHRGNKRNTKNA